MIDKQIWVVDIETLKSCFTYSAINIDSEEIVQFVIHENKNDLCDLISHLEECRGQIGFNNLNFDYSIIHMILNKYHIWIEGDFTPEEIVYNIYIEAQRIIEEQNKPDFNSVVAIKSRDVLIPQLDLFKLWHYNNAARSTSLKALEISMNYPNVMEMPIDHTRDDITLEEIPSILEYNLNDVLATFEFYKKSKQKIDLRQDLNKTYNLNCLNFSDSKIGEQLILKLYCDKTEKDIWEVKKQRTYRHEINFKDCILPYVQFESKEFTSLLNYFKAQTITETKGSIAKSVIYRGFKYDYGTGGVHGCIKSGVYESDDDYIIIDADVGSLYPNLAIQNGFFIEHLGKEFTEVYKTIIDLRMEAKKAKNMTLSDGFKLAANSCYGKSNDVNSFLYDPKFTMQITLNGQLLLTMLAEKLVDNLTNITVLQINTDGITVKIPRSEVPKYYELCFGWQNQTKLNLEYVEYCKIIVSDVNNYMAIDVNGKVKYKGKYEVDKVVGSEPAYHKDNSFRIIPLAISEYFTKGISIETTIKNHRNVYDFCGRIKFTRDSYGQIHYLQKDKQISEKQQKNVRYYISNKGATFYKYYNKGTNEVINKGYQVTIFNNYVKKVWQSYDVNYNFYIKEAMKIVNEIENKQLSLF